MDEIVYQVALIGAATASILLIAPSAHQRLRALDDGVARRHRPHLRTAVHLTIAGTLAVALSICAVIFLVTTVVFDDRVAAALTGTIAALVIWTWFEIPLFGIRENDERDS